MAAAALVQKGVLMESCKCSHMNCSKVPTGTCMECPAHFCVEHTESHVLMMRQAHVRHEVVPVLVNLDVFYCKEHNQKCQLYCLKCAHDEGDLCHDNLCTAHHGAICSMCAIMEHGGCGKPILLRDRLEFLKNMVTESRGKVEEATMSIDNLRVEIVSDRDTTKLGHAATLHAIEAHAQMLHEKIEAMKALAIGLADKTLGNKTVLYTREEQHALGYKYAEEEDIKQMDLFLIDESALLLNGLESIGFVREALERKETMERNRRELPKPTVTVTLNVNDPTNAIASSVSVEDAPVVPEEENIF